MPTITYRSRVDAWLVLVVVAGIVLVLAQAVLLLGRAPIGALVAFAVGIVTALTVVAMTLPCRYELHADHLMIRCGMIRQRIDYADITGVAPSRSMLSAPALSLRRVKISFRHGSQLVSPHDREGFITELQSRVARSTNLATTASPRGFSNRGLGRQPG